LKTCYRLTLGLMLLAVMLTGVPAMAAPMEATISLGRDQEPPMCAVNPAGTVDITWNIEHITTPNYVYFKLEDLTRTTILDEETYPGSTGITVNRQWTIPAGSVDGKYWIRVEYWSFEAGNEANAEVTFYVCTDTGSICVEKWKDIDQNDQCTGTDIPLENWWICLDTPLGDTFCKQTGIDGRVCWDGLLYGDYTVYEPVLGGLVPVGPSSWDVTLGATPLELKFCNKDAIVPTRQGSWGMIKSMYR
jgi:hypothetical protein